MTLGERIQAARKKANLKQTELAEMIGSSVVTVGQYERDKRQPRLEQLARIADALNVTVGYLQGEETIDAKQIVEALQKRDSSSLESLLGLDAGSILAIGQEQIASLESQRITEDIARRAGLTIKDSQGNIIHQGDGKPWQKATAAAARARFSSQISIVSSSCGCRSASLSRVLRCKRVR